MKYFFLLSFFILSSAFAGTCTNTTRTNYTTGQVLTSSALNADFNQLVTKVNAFDGGCVTDGTLEFSALNTTDFSPVLNAIQSGCALSYVDSNTVSIGRCIASVNGKSVQTTASINVTWGCSGCSSETSSTTYYVYAKNGSSGSTLNLLISTTAPNGDGYDSSSNKVLGRFFNNSSSDIVNSSIQTWNVSSFSSNDGKVFASGVVGPLETLDFFFGKTANAVCDASPCAFIFQPGNQITSITRSGTGAYSVTLARPWRWMVCSGSITLASSNGFLFPVTLNNPGTTLPLSTQNSANNAADGFGTVHCVGY